MDSNRVLEYIVTHNQTKINPWNLWVSFFWNDEFQVYLDYKKIKSNFFLLRFPIIFQLLVELMFSSLLYYSCMKIRRMTLVLERG